MEELGVFVAVDGSSNLSTKFPVEDAFFDRDTEGVNGERAKERLQVGERAHLFQSVEDVNEEAAVLFPEGGRSQPSGPTLATEPTLAQASNDARHRVGSESRRPGRNNSRAEGGVERPGFLKSKDSRVGGARGNGGEQMDVIGG